LKPQAKLFEVRAAFKPVEAEADDSPWDDEDNESEDLSSVPERLRLKYRDFFDTRKATQLPSHQATEHAIKLKPGTEPPYIRTFNMSPAELKALEKYLNDALVKGWICESQSSAGAPMTHPFRPQEKRRTTSLRRLSRPERYHHQESISPSTNQRAS